ncbi:putative zinc-dependent oxidoreductase [hydrothermal vent metagenome]|uniref:Putative zinc-dependent oxidoreductase n=1 Tax=hydrothermal vent metagenome TaxID=652676 RepID=A0A3B0VZR0_9ZZZZ
MKAIIAKQPGGPEVLDLVDIDQPVAQEGEVTIRVKAFGLNKAESYYRSGNYGTFVPDQALGIEAVGEIISDPNSEFRVGQKVATAMGGMMFARHGGYAEYITVNASNVVAIDSEISVEMLAALPEAYLTVWGALDKNLQIANGESLLVRGATSSVGMAAVTYAKARGLTVIATTRNPASVDKLKSIGADHVVIDDGDIHEKIRAIIPEGVNNALEVVGAATLKDTLKSIREWGQVVVIGLLGGAPVLESFNLMGDLPNTVRLSFFSSGLLGSEALPLNESPLNWVAEQIASGAMPSTIAKTFDAENIQEAHRILDNGTANGKIVVTF